jgi:hypothetical protein
MSTNDKVIIRIGNRDWKDVTNETVELPTYTLYEIVFTNGEPERIATNR